MVKNVLSRIRDRLANRHEEEEESDCCGFTIEEAKSGPTTDESNDCCE